MPLDFKYRDPKGVDEPAVSVTLDSVRFGTLSVSESAELGEPATSTLEVDDPDGTWNFVGLRALSIGESSAPSNNQMIIAAAIQDRKVTRGDSMLTGAARKWTLDLVDYNWHLGRQVFVDADAKRPAETAGDRMRWLLSSGTRFAIRDLGNVTYPSTSLDACDYRGQRLTDVLADCAIEGGYNFWIAYNEAASRPELFFMDPDGSDYSSSLRISNDLADIDYTTTFPPDEDAELNRSASRIAWGVYLAYAAGSVYVRNDVVAEQYAKVDQTAPMSNVKTAARARRVATKFLNDHDEETDRITCAIRVPAASVNAIRVGHRLQVKFRHFPGYESFQWARVLRRTVVQEPLGGGYYGTDNEESWYTLHLDLVPGGGTSYTCSTALSAAVGEWDWAPNTGELATITSTPTFDGTAMAVLLASNPNTPSSSGMAYPSGYDPIYGADFSRSTYTVSSRAISDGVAITASASFEAGFGTFGNWTASHVLLPVGMTLVRYAASNGSWFTAGLPGGAPTPGNIILMIGMADTSPGALVPYGSWTKLTDAVGVAPTARVVIWARCAVAGDTGSAPNDSTKWGHAGGGGYSTANECIYTEWTF